MSQLTLFISMADTRTLTASSRESIADSFFVVPPSSAPPVLNGKSTSTSTSPHSEPASRSSSKTAEELSLENASLKTALDGLARQYEHLVQERAQEKEALKGSIISFGKEVRREAERAALTVVAAKSPTPLPTVPLPSAACFRPSFAVKDMNECTAATELAKMQEMDTQLAAMKQELAVATASAAKYKVRPLLAVAI